jgi:hypothetical protein
MPTVLIAAMPTVLIAATMTAAMTTTTIRLPIVDTKKIPFISFFISQYYFSRQLVLVSVQLEISFHDFLPIHVLIFDLVNSSR